MVNYAVPDILVSTYWVASHYEDPGIKIIEVDVDTKAYEEGHIPGAIGWNWQTQLCDRVQRDIIPKQDLESLLGQSGITNDSTIILYGDNNNWFAAWAFWQIKMYGHQDIRIMNGGRKKWLSEGRIISKDHPKNTFTPYKTSTPDLKMRAYLLEVMEQYQNQKTVLVDVRSADEFSGKILAPPGLPETCQRGGHIPGAKNIGWGLNCNEDGTFKSADALKTLYTAHGVTQDKRVITYCRIGERSSLTWFVLKYLLGFPHVKNYDGSWTEWGNLVGAPVEKEI
jgi:thiosulfate/3-mercaptopyruvate sulfurtransferase